MVIVESLAHSKAKSPAQLIHRELSLRPASDRTMYAGVALSDREWKLELWVFFKSSVDEHGTLTHLEGIQDEDFATRRQSQRSVSWNADSGFLESNGSNLNLFPVGIISPELQETFLTNELRFQVIAAVAQKDWKVLYWLRQHDVRISRQYTAAIGRMIWLPAVLPAIPFDEQPPGED
jgi:hypothetical protein